MVGHDERELEYYRAVEDLFATLRGVPHIISPKDFQLLREWWRDEVPLSAVRAGIRWVALRDLHRRAGAVAGTLVTWRGAGDESGQQQPEEG